MTVSFIEFYQRERFNNLTRSSTGLFKYSYLLNFALKYEKKVRRTKYWVENLFNSYFTYQVDALI